MGIGVADVEKALAWYWKIFGTDIVMFKDMAAGSLIQQYTGHLMHNRLAILGMNLQGGGFEIW